MKAILAILINITLIFAYVAEISAKIGKIEIIRNNNKIYPTLGFKLDNKDTIITYKNAKVQIIFKDRTIITVGPNSKFSIKDYLFDNTSNSKAKFSFTKGLIKVLDGAIGKIAPKKFRITTKNAVIGIRGTMFVVEIKKNITLLGMLEGNTFFKPFSTNKIYTLKTGEYLIFNHISNQVTIKKGFVEPTIIKSSKKSKNSTKNSDKTTNNKQKSNSNQQNTTSTNSTKNENTTSNVQNTTETSSNNIETPTNIQQETNENDKTNNITKTVQSNETILTEPNNDNTIYNNLFFKIFYTKENNKLNDVKYDIVNSNVTPISEDELNDYQSNNLIASYSGTNVAIINNQLVYGMNRLFLNFPIQQFKSLFTMKPENDGPSWLFEVKGNINNDGTISSNEIITLDESDVKNIDGTLNGTIYTYNYLAGNFNFKGTYYEELSTKDLSAKGVYLSNMDNTLLDTPNFHVIKATDYTLLGYWEIDNSPIIPDFYVLGLNKDNAFAFSYQPINLTGTKTFEGDTVAIIDNDHTATGSFNLNIDFDNQQLDGTFNFKDNNTLWEFSVKGEINNFGNFILQDNISETEKSNITDISGVVFGKVFNQNVVGGNFSILGNGYDHSAFGSFVGESK